MAPIPALKATSRAAKELSTAENLQVAHVLADLNQLQNATDQKAALALLQIKNTLDRRQSLSRKTLPTPENVYGSLRKRESYGMLGLNPLSTPSMSPSPAARARAESRASSNGMDCLASRSAVTPLIRAHSATSSSASSCAVSSRRSSAVRGGSTVREHITSTLPAIEDPDLLRAHTLLALHSTRSTLLKAYPSFVSSPSDSTPLDTARRNVSFILAKYTMLKQEEMARDPQGMRTALEGVGLNGY